ncbi:hypothetical protein [Streptomyces sp. NPDC059008]|uniref:hypothetical protein n=1 Tax=Streptomyces sp. NPDC059008 TaxID=3346693 RepID=UPI00368D3C79
MNKSTVRPWMLGERLPTEDSLRLFCEGYNAAVKGSEGYSAIPDDERDRALGLLASLQLQNAPAQRLQEERARYDAVSRTAAEVQADRDGLLAELADERRTAAERCYALEQRLETLQARHRRDQRRLRQQRRKGAAQAGRRRREAAVHAAAHEELAQAQRLITELRHALTTSAEAHQQDLTDRDTKLAEYRDELTTLRDRLTSLELDQADRDAADAAVREAIATVDQAHAQLQHCEPDPDRLAGKAREKEVIAQLRAADGDPPALRRILRTVATTWSDKDIDWLVFALCYMSMDNDWGPALARRLARRARVRYWVEPDISRLVRGPGYGTRMWCLLRGIRVVTLMSWPDTFFKPLKEPIGSLRPSRLGDRRMTVWTVCV